MSTLVELAGFTAWVVAAFAWQSVALSTVTGLLALGAVLLLVGYSLDGLTLKTVTAPIRAKWSTSRATKQAKAASK